MCCLSVTSAIQSKHVEMVSKRQDTAVVNVPTDGNLFLLRLDPYTPQTSCRMLPIMSRITFYVASGLLKTSLPLKVIFTREIPQ